MPDIREQLEKFLDENHVERISKMEVKIEVLEKNFDKIDEKLDALPAVIGRIVEEKIKLCRLTNDDNCPKDKDEGNGKSNGFLVSLLNMQIGGKSIIAVGIALASAIATYFGLSGN